jgi:16S rRNA processing protein RimM
MSSRRDLSKDDAYICVGKITAAHGIRGEVKLLSHLSEPTSIAELPTLRDRADTQSFAITIRGQQKKQLIAQVKSIQNRNDAEALRGTELYALKSELPDTNEEGTFSYDELVGLKARAEDGTMIGEVIAVHNFGAGDILELRMTATDKTEMFSFTASTVPTINPDEGWLMLCPPDILMAPEEERDD